MKKIHTRSLAVFLSAALVVMSVGSSRASLAPALTDQSVAARAQDLGTVQRFLEQKEVGQHLARLKLTPNEIESRISNLSDQDLHQVAVRIDQQNPGRDGSGAVVTVLLIGILALLFIYLAKRV